VILKNLAGGYRVRWREHGILRQQTVATWEDARKLDAKKVLKQRGGQRRVIPQKRDVLVQDYAVEKC
jgi:hypothetical protein